ncbi:MAG TPA: rhodanese-like domain-containing protein [Bryobacteraceae bacterium]|nr:rhodanese-like domain-containing protein [Bryobacteraceae bacterium]
MKHSQAFLDLVNQAKKHVIEIDVAEFQRRREAGSDFLLIDVREDNEWNAGHAAGALHLGKGIIERDIESKVGDKNRELILYCGGGFRSALAAEALQKMGYTKVISLDGGWREYQAAGLPVER